MNITTRERGWPGHFIGAHMCVFRRNTLVSDVFQGRHIVVSTVGAMRTSDTAYGHIGSNRIFETMMFIAAMDPSGYLDADVGREVYTDEPWSIAPPVFAGIDENANSMHEGNVAAVVRDFDRLWDAFSKTEKP